MVNIDMDTKAKKDILYRPSDEIVRDYKTDGFIEGKSGYVGLEKSQEIYPTRSEIIKRNGQGVVNELLKVMNIIEALPLELPGIFRNILEPMTILIELNSLEIDSIYEEDVLAQLEGKYVESCLPQPTIESDSFSGNKDTENGSANSDITYKPFDIEVSTIAAKPVSYQCREQYLSDLNDITLEFAKKLNGAMQGYLYPLSTILNELGLDSPDYLNFSYEGESVTGIERNIQHLSDRIVIQECVTEQLSALMSKTHSQAVLLDAIKAFDAAEALRERYYSEEYNLNIKTDMDIFSNNLLKKARDSSEAAYRQAKINLFKFLDSSVETMRDICSKKLEAQEAKAILLKNNVNIYAHREFETSGIENSASNQGQIPSKIQPQTDDIEKSELPGPQSVNSISKVPVKDTQKALFEALDIRKTAENAKNSVKNEAKNEISEQNDKIKDEINASLSKLTDNLAEIL